MLSGPATHRTLRQDFSLRPRVLFPGIVGMAGYQKSWLRFDILAGVTVAAYLIPQVMAYAQIAGLPAAYGLFGVVGPAVVYFAMGSSRTLSVGPESTVSLLTGTAVAGLAIHGRSATALAAALAIVVGGLCLLGWLGGLGFLADLLSRPVLVGYLAGVAVLMVVSQIEKVTGVAAPGESLPSQLYAFATHIQNVHWPTLLLALGLLAFLLTMAKIAPKLPNPLFAVLIGTAVVYFFHLGDLGIKTVGDIPRTLPLPDLPSLRWADVSAMILPALGITLVAYSDNMLTARAFSEPGEPPIEANQEFLALGVANVAAGVMGGFAVSSSASRTAIATLLRAKTQVYSLACAATVLASVFFLGGLLSHFPKAALGALVVYAATRLVELDEIKRIYAFRRSETVLMVATTLAVFFFGVLNGIVLAVLLSLGDLLRRVARPRDAILGYIPGLGGMHDISDYDTATQVPGLVVYRYDSPLFFANADDFRARATAALDTAERPVYWFIVNAEANVEVDLTSLDALEQLRVSLAEEGITLAMARVKQDLLIDLSAHGFAGRIGEEHIFPTLPEAVRAYLKWHKRTFGHLPEGVEKIPKPAKPAVIDTTADDSLPSEDDETVGSGPA